MGVRSGYKQSEVGVIPEGWSIESLGGAGRWLSGGTPSMPNDTFWGGEIPWVSAKDMKVPRLRDSKLHVTQSAIGNGTRVAPLGSILIVVRGMILAHTLPVAEAERPIAFNQDIKALVPREGIHSEFLTLWLQANSSLILPLCSESTHGTKRLPSADLFAVKFPLPKKGEQRAIAGALGDVDALLAGLDRLIAKKRDLKHAAMQQLLTGQTRLPGFRDEWEISSVGAEFEVELGKMLDAEKNSGSPRPFLGNRSVQWGLIDVSDIGLIRLMPSELERYRLRGGDLLVCEGGEVGRAAIWRDELPECYYQKALHRLRPKRGYSPVLMLYILRRYAATGALLDFTTQTSIAHLPKDRLETLPLPALSGPEQSAIAEVLSGMDAELAALEARREKTRSLKQAIMQELLTGRIRLV
jgi:type I restriction enzyme, S subunit